MLSKSLSLRIATHLLALAAGWAGVRAFHPKTETAGPQSGKAEPATSGRRTAGPDGKALLEAYENPAVMTERIVRRNQRPPEELPVGTPDERAAATQDIAGDLNKELAKIEASKGCDYLYVKALIGRWMKEDPAACSGWLGAMTCKTGWLDPFDAFAHSLPCEKLLDLMETGWLARNRSLALGQMAHEFDSKSAADLPAILSRLSEKEAKFFLSSATSQAEVTDAAAWLKVAGGDEKTLESLAAKWIAAPRSGQGDAPSGTDWQQKAEQALAAATGTPAEALFRQRYEAEILAAKVEGTLAHLPEEPAAGAAALEAIYRDQGLSPDEARRRMMDEVTSRYRNGLSDWNRAEWQDSLQQAMLGKQPLHDAVENRLAAIDRDLPEFFKESSRALAMQDAMAIDPATVIDVAVARGLTQDGVKAATEFVQGAQASFTVRGEVFQALASHDLPGGGDVKFFAQEYHRYDPKAAESWRQSLPASLAQSLKEVMR